MNNFCAINAKIHFRNGRKMLSDNELKNPNWTVWQAFYMHIKFFFIIIDKTFLQLGIRKKNQLHRKR